MPRGRPRKTGDGVLLKSAELIGWAIGGLEREIAQTRDRLAALTARANQLRKRVGRTGGQAAGLAVSEPSGRKRRRRRRMSPEARKRISEMMKKRWAERRRGK